MLIKQSFVEYTQICTVNNVEEFLNFRYIYTNLPLICNCNEIKSNIFAPIEISVRNHVYICKDAKKKPHFKVLDSSRYSTKLTALTAVLLFIDSYTPSESIA